MLKARQGDSDTTATPPETDATPVTSAEAGTPPAPTAAAPSAEVVAGIPKLVDLGADKCVPCKMMAPILDELKEEYAGRFDVEFIDVWKNKAAGEEYGIQMIPTQIFFDASGTELFRHTGFMAKEDILAKWKELGVEFAASSTDESSNEG
ncbi:MAG: thioredoxin family protein [bacterium]|nr:thioredoxin family protein [bacterium]